MLTVKPGETGGVLLHITVAELLGGSCKLVVANYCSMRSSFTLSTSFSALLS